ncbi:hypothetical protein P255_00726 [Acinetobacter brisouii CIP 110357]|uniref:ChrR-like cupin domain-containing protein n=1 Tax=Acinetobacter brisouii CIP 110357 TaxID=1341683 RepID=V2UV93_9GAMM|nr:cupin domain-containing protein [Acinetobacter brisouii]ENV46582.1 hypothetical protein F954_02566 [Acinetobacter brisouii ANC 4119]ESK52570.1 hypothetical protein P255_00726 [Acinetobacter brisouii CIP 110357]
MLINADFSQSVMMTPEQYEWIPSPQKGIDRVMLDRIGAEKARATSIVRYAPSSIFPPHNHPNGEEILVLDGTFSEKGHDYPTGWYLRNPDGTSHQPFSHDGAVIFVKLRQMSSDDDQTIRVNTNLIEAWHTENGQRICPLFQNENEKVELRQIPMNDLLQIESDQFTEILILDGTLNIDHQVFPTGSWIRLAKNSNHGQITAKTQVKLYLKTMKNITNID